LKLTACYDYGGCQYHFPLLLAAAPLKRLASLRLRGVAGSFSAAFSGGPIEARESDRAQPSPCQFSAAFSGGPIEATRPAGRSATARRDFPLLLAAAPLKRRSRASTMPRAGDFPLLLAAAPLKQGPSSASRPETGDIFRCF